MATKLSEYWRQREEEQRKRNITDEAKYDKVVDRMYRESLADIQKEIDAFYGRYAAKEGISITDAKKRVDKLDIEAYERLAKRVVADKDFSPEANQAMRLYNLTMKVNRLEMLKSMIGVHLVSLSDSLDKYYTSKLDSNTAAEIKRQAGIMGDTIGVNDKQVHAIVNASFHSAHFSERIWVNNSYLKQKLEQSLLASMIRGERPDYRAFKRIFGSSLYEAKRLLHTELKRCRTEAAMQQYDRNGVEEFEFMALGPHPCEFCTALNGKHFKVKDFLPGDNAPPMHPHCRCSTAPWVDEKAYNDWLDAKADGTFSGGLDDWKDTLRFGRGSGSPDIKAGESEHIGNVDFSDKPRVLKILDAAERKFAGADVEWDVTVTSDGKIWVTKGSAGGVSLVGISSDREGAYSYHNHLDEHTNYSFSEDDVAGLIANKEAYMRASDSSYSYEMWRRKDTVDKPYDEVYHRFVELRRNKAYQAALESKIDADEDGNDYTMRLMSAELRFLYERKRKS
nr:MAG TPA: minor capsid protein [Caudoviricetes sp.]